MLKSKSEITTNLDKKLYFSIPRVDMETPPPDNDSLDPSVATNMQGEEEGASADVNVNNSAEESNKLHFPRNKKSTYSVEWRPVHHPKDYQLLLYCSFVIGEDYLGRN